jgi:trans-2,3-dihydro-3-hydroxyanthranilate isomerase
MGSEQHFTYRVVDVFTKQALEGNPLAVFTDASAIEPPTMQRIARELNLAETTFVLPSTRSDCAARVRIFTPAKEMLFAGHPTIGTSFVLLDEGRVPAATRGFSLEENVGPVAVRVEAGERPMIWLSTPPISAGRTYDAALCAKVLGLDAKDLLEVAPQQLSAGNPTLFIALRDKESVDRAWLDLAGMKLLRGSEPELFCVFVFTPTEEGVYSRMFAPEYGISEDPATGSSTGPLVAFMMRLD